MRPPELPEGVVWREDEPLARHVACRTGGACDAFVVVHAVDALAPTVDVLRKLGMSWQLLGAGTRTVVRDGGVGGAVVRLGTGFSTVDVADGPNGPGSRWTVGAAVPLPALVAATSSAGMGGVEDRADVPGSLGASLALDGWSSETAVRYLHRGKIREGTLGDAGKSPIVAATLDLHPEDGAAIRKRALARLKGEVALKAPWVPPGSWYVPPKKVPLRDVLDRAHLRDVRLRDVAMPAEAPEVLVNLGDAPARDLHLLFQSALERVRRETGVELEARVSWIGRPH